VTEKEQTRCRRTVSNLKLVSKDLIAIFISCIMWALKYLPTSLNVNNTSFMTGERPTDGRHFALSIPSGVREPLLFYNRRPDAPPPTLICLLLDLDEIDLISLAQMTMDSTRGKAMRLRKERQPFSHALYSFSHALYRGYISYILITSRNKIVKKYSTPTTVDLPHKIDNKSIDLSEDERIDFHSLVYQRG